MHVWSKWIEALALHYYLDWPLHQFESAGVSSSQSQSKPVSPVDLSSEDTIPRVHVFCKPKGLPRFKGHVEGITQDYKIFNEDINNDNDDNNDHNKSNSSHPFPANKKERKFHKIFCNVFAFISIWYLRHVITSSSLPFCPWGNCCGTTS